jgi:hypothetical protein
MICHSLLLLLLLFLIGTLSQRFPHIFIQFHKNVNGRIFNVLVEGSMVLNNFDIFRDAPGRFVPEIITVNTFVTDGTITIDFIAVTGDPSINGIEIIYPTGNGIPLAPSVPTTVTKTPTKAPTKAPTMTPTNAPTNVPTKIPTNIPVVAPTASLDIVLNRINCGSNTSVTMTNITWSADQYSSVGRPYNTCGNITNSIYCTSRYFQLTRGTPFRYNIPVPYNNASYQVRLHFAEQVRFVWKLLDATIFYDMKTILIIGTCTPLY